MTRSHAPSPASRSLGEHASLLARAITSPEYVSSRCEAMVFAFARRDSSPAPTIASQAPWPRLRESVELFHFDLPRSPPPSRRRETTVSLFSPPTSLLLLRISFCSPLFFHRTRISTEHVFYFRCPLHRLRYVLSFVFCFDRAEEVYQFAFSYPYSVSRLYERLSFWEVAAAKEAERSSRRSHSQRHGGSVFFRRDRIGQSLVRLARNNPRTLLPMLLGKLNRKER